MRDIETSRLLLRAWRVNDATEAASVFRYASDPLVGPRAGWPPHASVDESARIVRDVLAVENNWAIIVKFEGDGPVGSIALKPFSSQLSWTALTLLPSSGSTSAGSRARVRSRWATGSVAPSGAGAT